ncbi:MAG TPA: hypothetical protein VJ179_02475 [Patescibacteria group bacterium]|nr:hypothetical protein [Patescibacteria group bacterium]
MKEKIRLLHPFPETPRRKISPLFVKALSVFFFIGMGMTAGYTLRAIQDMQSKEGNPSRIETEIQLPELEVSEKTTFETILRRKDEIAPHYLAVTATDGIIVGGNSHEVAILTQLPEDPTKPHGDSYDVINHLFFASHESLEQGKQFSIGDKVNGKVVFLPQDESGQFLPVPVRIFHTNETEQAVQHTEFKPLLDEVRTIEVNRDPNTQRATLL